MHVPQLALQPNPPATSHLPRLRSMVITGSVATALFVVLAVTVQLAGGTTALDNAVYAAVQAHRTAGATRIAAAITALGSYQFVIVLTVVFAAATLALTRRLTHPLLLLISAPVASSLVLMIKVALGRHRPPSAVLMGESPTDYSFPSGHTTSGSVLFLLAGLLISSRLQARWARHLVRSVGVVVAISVGVSRVVLGYHWTTDVIGGWLLATALTATAIAAATMIDHLRPIDISGQVVAPETGTAPTVRVSPDVPLPIESSRNRTNGPASRSSTVPAG